MSNEFRDLPPAGVSSADDESDTFPERRPDRDATRSAAASEIFAWALIGIGLLLVGTLFFAIGSSADEGSAGGDLAALLGAVLLLAGTLVTTVAVVAKGVQLGNRAS